MSKPYEKAKEIRREIKQKEDNKAQLQRRKEIAKNYTSKKNK